MPPARTCSECPKSLRDKSSSARTCSNACRLKRSRRLARANRETKEFEEQHGSGAQEIAAIVRREAPDVVHRVMREQLQPVVREALTEDVLRAVRDMVGLTAAAVAALQADLSSDNETIRQRAYSLVIKYTIGHPALVQPAEGDDTRQMVVNFNLPRPDEVPENDELPVTAESDELQPCDMCNVEKPASEFMDGSTRCAECFSEWKDRITAQFA